MPDRAFADAELASLYDIVCTGRPDFPFYLPVVMSAPSVLDVGCGTGALLHLAREAGHTGRLCGLDPAPAMLSLARRRPDIEWVLGDLSSTAWSREFDLIVMTGHAFQVLLTDAELSSALTKIRTALTPSGRFVFEIRNPLAREWERWTPANAVELTDASGARIRMEHQVQTVAGDLVSFTAPNLPSPQTSRSTLRFLDPLALSGFLSAAGLAIHEQLGDWDSTPLTDTSPEIITFAGLSRVDQAPG